MSAITPELCREAAQILEDWPHVWCRGTEWGTAEDRTGFEPGTAVVARRPDQVERCCPIGMVGLVAGAECRERCVALFVDTGMAAPTFRIWAANDDSGREAGIYRLRRFADQLEQFLTTGRRPWRFNG